MPPPISGHLLSSLFCSRHRRCRVLCCEGEGRKETKDGKREREIEEDGRIVVSTYLALERPNDRDRPSRVKSVTSPTMHVQEARIALLLLLHACCPHFPSHLARMNGNALPRRGTLLLSTRRRSTLWCNVVNLLSTPPILPFHSSLPPYPCASSRSRTRRTLQPHFQRHPRPDRESEGRGRLAMPLSEGKTSKKELIQFWD